MKRKISHHWFYESWRTDCFKVHVRLILKVASRIQEIEKMFVSVFVKKAITYSNIVTWFRVRYVSKSINHKSNWMWASSLCGINYTQPEVDVLAKQVGYELA